MRDKENNKEFGDYQTPLCLSSVIVEYIKKELSYIPDVILEPTCGVGSFIKAVNTKFENSLIIGNEIDKKYVQEVKKIVPENKNKIIIYNNNYFKWEEKPIIEKNSKLLVIGNPPWVTNSSMSLLMGDNIPQKSNFKQFKGIDAITGSSNFDISEYIILDLINEYYLNNPLIVMICKTNVAINVFKHMHGNNIGADFIKIKNIDASKSFNVSVDASILFIKLNCNNQKVNYMEWVGDKNQGKKTGYVNESFYMDLSRKKNILDGKTEIEWRQGIKHDSSRIMELNLFNRDEYINGLKNKIILEDDRIYPLVKSSHFKFPIINSFKKYVIVTQDFLKQDTSYIKDAHPKLWKYLNDNIEHFENRKSSIYKNSPNFSMFGIGEYTWKPYKIGVSGFYKDPMFSLLVNKKPVMLDDTGYFLGFDDYDVAYTIMIVLNSEEVKSFLKQISNLNAKRPYTKKILSRISLKKGLELLPYEVTKKIEKSLGLESYLTKEIYIKTMIFVNLKYNN